MIHFCFWVGGPTIRIYDMTNAGKRGKTCRLLTAWCGYDSAAAEALRAAPEEILGSLGAQRLEHGGMFVEGLDFDAVADEFRQWQENYFDLGACTRVEEVKAIKAPRRKLLAGGEGWGASADENGIRLADLADTMNEPRVITAHGQSKARAYDIAAKVWPQVQAAESFSKAWDVLSKAGASLHYFCAVD